MAKIDLTKYGITGTTEIVHNPSYEELFKEETRPELEGYEVGQETELGAVNVMTGVYTGRSPKDKFIVMDENSKDTVWWTSDEYKNDNHPASEETWKAVKEIAKKELSNKKLYVVDAFCGANKDTRMAVRFIVEVAWQAHFVTNMFITPSAEELENFEPDFVVYNASKAKVENYKELGLNSETAVVFNITSREQVIINTWYGGEMKKGMFSMMNYYLPLKGIASMHCSANTDKNGENTATCVGCMIAGLGGLYYVMDYACGVWSNDAFGDRGWLAIALVIFTIWRPNISVFASFLFGGLYILYLYLPTGIEHMEYQELYKMIPYVVTLLVLVITSMRSKRENQPPASLGLAYFREER